MFQSLKGKQATAAAEPLNCVNQPEVSIPRRQTGHGRGPKLGLGAVGAMVSIPQRQTGHGRVEVPDRHQQLVYDVSIPQRQTGHGRDDHRVDSDPRRIVSIPQRQTGHGRGVLKPNLDEAGGKFQSLKGKQAAAAASPMPTPTRPSIRFNTSKANRLRPRWAFLRTMAREWFGFNPSKANRLRPRNTFGLEF